MKNQIIVKQCICTYKEIPIDLTDQQMEELVRYEMQEEDFDYEQHYKIIAQLCQLANIPKNEYNDFIIDTDTINNQELKEKFETYIHEHEHEWKIMS